MLFKSWKKKIQKNIMERKICGRGGEGRGGDEGTETKPKHHGLPPSPSSIHHILSF